MAGTARALARYGYADLTVEHIVAEAGVPRAAFYESFGNKRECVLVAHDQSFNRLTAELFHACSRESEWTGKVAAAIAAAIGFAVAAPEDAQLLVVDTVAADPALASRLLDSNDFLIDLLRNGREQCPHADSLPELTERVLIGAITSVVGARLLSGQADQLPGLEPQLVQLLLMPYVGGAEAREIAEGAG
jgi:AcrR family transcriptional regulator